MAGTSTRSLFQGLLALVATAACQPSESREIRTIPQTTEESPSETANEGDAATTADAETDHDDLVLTTRGAAADGETSAPREELVEPERAHALPGPEGMLGTWRIWATSAHALPDETEDTLGVFCEETPAGCKRAPRFFVTSSNTLDLRREARGALDTVYLGGRLWTPRRTKVHLLIGLQGQLSVRLDGREVLDHRSRRLRGDDVLATLDLSPGDHALVMRFTRPERGGFRTRIRVLDERLAPGTAPARFGLGRLDAEDARALGVRAVKIDESHRLGESGPEALFRAWLPAGGVEGPVDLELDGDRTIDPGEHTFTSGIEHLIPFPRRGRLDLIAKIGGRRVRLGGRVPVDRLALTARAALLEVLEKAPTASRAPLAWRAAEIERIVRENDPDGGWRQLMVSEARRFTKAVSAGRDPFGKRRGYQRMAFFSELDDTAQPYELFVPYGYRHEGERRWPLVITLHGFKGNAGDYFRNTFGLPRDHDGGETLLAHGRHGEPPRQGRMFVIAPTGRGQAMYRHAGETDILEALADVQRRFRIDANRIYVTGGSMGGTGAAYIPYRHPDLFAASAALAGYHDQRVRRDTSHEDLSAVERFLQAERSDVDWAENGLHLHTLLVRGTKDQPVEWTRSLVRRLKTLDYPHEHREPEAGHNVWTVTYAGGAIFRYFARFRRPEAPREVRFRTARERTSKAWWVRIDQRAAPDVFADVHARIQADGRILVTTEGARALTLSPNEELVAEGELQVEIDGDTITGARPLSLHRTAEGWEPSPSEYPPLGHKRPGASGPIRDVFHDPLIFVVGTQDPGHIVINRRVAEYWANPHGWIADYPIVEDTHVTDEMIRDHTLVLIGPPSSNLLTRRWNDGFPIRFEDGGIRVGETLHQGAQVGTVFVAPHPEARNRSLLIIAGFEPLGTWRSLCLPDILPDYVVFDEEIAPARGRWAAGGTGATYREEGLFGLDWSLDGGVRLRESEAQ